MTDPVDISAESIKRAIGMCKAAGLHGTAEKLRTLLSERDALACEVEGAMALILVERAEVISLRKQLAEARNAALDEAAAWHDGQVAKWQKIINGGDTVISGISFGAWIAGHSADADAIRALKEKSDG